MTLAIPNAAEVIILEDFLDDSLVLKLYSNDVTPSESSTAGTFTEVTGGGYSSIALNYEDWTIAAGDPSVANFVTQYFLFSGAVGGSGIIYGYYVVNGAGVLKWAERFATSLAPIAGSWISIDLHQEAS